MGGIGTARNDSRLLLRLKTGGRAVSSKRKAWNSMRMQCTFGQRVRMPRLQP